MPWFFRPTHGGLVPVSIKVRDFGRAAHAGEGTMSRRDVYLDAMAPELGAACYRALHGEGSAAEAS